MSKSKSNRKYMPPIPSKAAKSGKPGKGSKPKVNAAAPEEETSPAMQAGLDAVAKADEQTEATAQEPGESQPPAPAQQPNWMPVGGRQKGASKLNAVIELLQRPEGATIQEVMDATGWQQHTVRSSITHAIAKVRGYNVVKNKPQGGATIYKIAADEE